MQPDAEVRLPADSAYVSVIRMVSSAIAARLDFTLDEVEDLRMAVSEACAMVLTGSRPGGSLTTGFTLGDGRLEVRVSADAVDPADPDTDSFAWQVLTTTADRVTAETTADSITVSLTVVSATAGSRS